MTITLTARGLLFDMDGTLVDSLDVVVRIWSGFAVDQGLDPEVVLAAAHGVRMEDTIARFAPEGSDLDALHDRFQRMELEDVGGVREVPGARALLASLPSDRFAIVTSATPELYRIRMEAAGLPLGATVVDAGSVSAGKPAPDPYLRGAALLGVDPTDTIVFEDAEAGIRSGLAAGATVVVVGDHESDATIGLARIADYRDVRVEVDDAGLVLRIG
ncbi:HAD-IA family hydrolase [Agromyces seonyuensis]|uniref:HAD-IA family hydrolase n=1 Tax=Agromyces seonyuensis TaxID=2662446 RepID=A0A6I4P2B0_9MICO|nr:HAD-IA family hydrolase [Agromyces seonyuensis]MWB98199.1 HAD-IA family hydrolase [Agromyces seonyuensis]